MSYKNLFFIKFIPVQELIFIPILFYPPLIFVTKISNSLRVALFMMLTAYLLLVSKRFQNKDFVTVILLGAVLSNASIANLGNSSGMITTGSLILTLVFAYALSRATDTNSFIKNKLVSFYINFFILVALGSLISSIFFITFGEMDIFDIDFGGAGYFYTPFGTLQYKGLFGFDVYRSIFFFREPAFIGFFCAANIFLVAPNIKEKSNFFLVCNIVSGCLTFSYYFFILSALLLMAKYIKFSFKTGVGLVLLFILLNYFAVDFLRSSSFYNRMYRVELFFKAMKALELSEIIFGKGFITEPVYDQSFAAGIVQITYEIGIVGLIGLILFSYLTLNLQSKYLFILFITSMIVFESIKMPLFWTLLVVLSVLLPNKHKIKSNILSQCKSAT